MSYRKKVSGALSSSEHPSGFRIGLDIEDIHDETFLLKKVMCAKNDNLAI